MSPLPRRLAPAVAERTQTVFGLMTPGALEGRSKAIGPVAPALGSRAAGGGAGGITADFGVAFAWEPHTLTAAGAQTFTLAQTPKPYAEHVYLNGLEQREGTDWSRSGTTLNVLAAMGTEIGDVLECRYAYAPTPAEMLPDPPVLGDWITLDDVVVTAQEAPVYLTFNFIGYPDVESAADAIDAVKTALQDDGFVDGPLTGDLYAFPLEDNSNFIELSASDEATEQQAMAYLVRAHTTAGDLAPVQPPYSTPLGYVLSFESVTGVPVTDVSYTSTLVSRSFGDDQDNDWDLLALALPTGSAVGTFFPAATVATYDVLQTLDGTKAFVPTADEWRTPTRTLAANVAWDGAGADLLLAFRPYAEDDTWEVFIRPTNFTDVYWNFLTPITRSFTYTPPRVRYDPA